MKALNSISKLEINCRVLETFGFGSITHTFTNNTADPVEIVLNVPIDDRMVITWFRCILGASIIESKVIKKEEAEEKYNSAVKKGNTALLGTVTKENKKYSFETKVGYLQPGETLQVEYSFSIQLKSVDLSAQLFIDFHRLPRSLIEPVDSIDFNFQASFEGLSRITRLSCQNYTPNIQPGLDATSLSINIQSDQIKNENLAPLDILFRVEAMNKPRIYTQFSHRTFTHTGVVSFTQDERDYGAQATLDTSTVKYHKKFEDSALRQAKGYFVFVLDQSGSMAGAKLTQAKEALTLFLRSLPADSEFELYGFGSTWAKYTPEPQKVSKQAINDILKLVKVLKPDMAGTKFYPPLESVFKGEYKAGMARNVFLLTDGEAVDMDATVDLFKTDNQSFRVHCIGIGNEVDHKFLTSLSSLTRGVFQHVDDKSMLSSYIISILNVALRPYISQVEFETNQDVLIKHSSNNIFYHDEVVDFEFVSESAIDFNSLEIKMKYFDPFQGKKIENTLDFGGRTRVLDNGEELSKLVVGQYLKTDPNLKMALQYQILTEQTALYCESANSADVLPMKKVEVDLNPIEKEVKEEVNPKDEIDPADQALIDQLMAEEMNEQNYSSRYSEDEVLEYQKKKNLDLQVGQKKANFTEFEQTPMGNKSYAVKKVKSQIDSSPKNSNLVKVRKARISKEYMSESSSSGGLSIESAEEKRNTKKMMFIERNTSRGNSESLSVESSEEASVRKKMKMILDEMSEKSLTSDEFEMSNKKAKLSNPKGSHICMAQTFSSIMEKQKEGNAHKIANFSRGVDDSEEFSLQENSLPFRMENKELNLNLDFFVSTADPSGFWEIDKEALELIKTGLGKDLAAATETAVEGCIDELIFTVFCLIFIETKSSESDKAKLKVIVIRAKNYLKNIGIDYEEIEKNILKT